MDLQIFGTVHSLMNGIHLIDSCQAHLSVPYASNIKSFARSDTGVLIDSEPHLSRTCKTSFLVAPLAVLFTQVVPLFRFTLQQNR